MPVLVKNYASVGTADFSIAPASLVLKLQVSMHSLVYAIQSLTHHRVLFLAKYEFQHVETDLDWRKRVEEIIESDELLRVAYGKIVVAIDGNYALAPTKFKGLLENNDESGVEVEDCELIFEVPDALGSKLKEHFGCEIIHTNAALLQANGNERLILSVGLGYFDAAYFDFSGKLQLMNRFEFKADADFIYFVLLCCEKLRIDREEVKLLLAGEIEKGSPLYELCYKYFQNVDFAKPEGAISFSKAFDGEPLHRYFNLYSLAI